MTEDEKRRQKADLLLEFEEAEEHLNHLREKALRTGQRIEAVAKWLQTAGEQYTSSISDNIHVHSGSGAQINVATDPQVEIAMNYASATKLIDDIRTAIRKIQELKQRKANLGLK